MLGVFTTAASSATTAAPRAKKPAPEAISRQAYLLPVSDYDDDAGIESQ